ncbi:MAG TPA: TlpA disulfide reductase family protein [bacterium]|nr:TlpA disulfide reductase family protein [bacterium]
MRSSFLFLLFLLLPCLSFAVDAPAPATEGLAEGSPLVDFGMRVVDLESGKLKNLLWLTDFVGRPPQEKNGSATAERKKALVLNFYANWCKPCIEEMPLLQKLHDRYSGKGVQFLGVNFRNDDENPDKVLAGTIDILKKEKITYPILFDRFTTRNQLIYMGSKAILPTVVIFNADGVMVKKLQGEKTKNIKEIETTIQKLTGEAARY